MKAPKAKPTPRRHHHIERECCFEKEFIMAALDDLKATLTKIAADLTILVAAIPPAGTGATEAQLADLNSQASSIDASIVAATPTPAP